METGIAQRLACKRADPPDFADRTGETFTEDEQGLPPWKRAIDIAFTLGTSPLWLPVMFCVSLFIKFVSPGPVLFRQERIGHHGRRFTCFKFRTMRVNADTGVHQGHYSRLMTSNVPMKKLDAAGDPRLIAWGIWLRSLGLDELPQLFNVLRGDMSLVGPRPCLPYEYASYAPRDRLRFDAVPGLTGLWQVSGKNKTTFVEMINMDIHYARNKCLALDLKILFKTIPAVLSQTKELKNEIKPVVADASLERR
ncbi:MAG TPA: sugar transferase [Verrucomicrobiae bacterium]|nr:sugar transferase [Verrucomicrobiae bacterium]